MNKPIGIFDSGIGGLTVVKHLMKLLPEEDLVYFGDTARVPYGTRSNSIIKQYALEDAVFLQQFDIKLLVVACNTASAIATDILEAALPVPVIGVILPGAERAIEISKNKRIGVIATTATINSNAYNTKIKNILYDAKVFTQPCPLLIPLVEEGWIDEEITRLTVRKYLEPVLKRKIDTLILGCTHFPVIRDIIQSESGPDISIIDSGKETAVSVKRILQEKNIRNEGIKSGKFQFYVSDIPLKFDQIAERFLEQPIRDTKKVDFEAFVRDNNNKIYEMLNLYS